MGTTAFVGYRYGEKVQGFSMSGNGYYEVAGMDVLKKFEALTKEELITFFTKKVTFLDSESENMVIQEKIEDALEACYDIWEIDWKKDEIEIEDGESMTGKDTYSREYGYVFNLNDDTVEVYNQGDYDEDFGWIEEPHILKFILTRENIEKVKVLFENTNDIQEHYKEELNFEEVFLKEK